ncbi:Hypothetical predicted protein [Olea europaea subsp. europaea]|uniref:Uncharacterized protein n=1 Tax=Olea europaea subsp. europaea TaxID=158383 RepID=A0A8S0T1H9_OLEEU|nr:Hypothetical predicted protein [Olea europaea subsp. europaea]
MKEENGSFGWGSFWELTWIIQESKSDFPCRKNHSVNFNENGFTRRRKSSGVWWATRRGGAPRCVGHPTRWRTMIGQSHCHEEDTAEVVVTLILPVGRRILPLMVVVTPMEDFLH